MNHHLFTIKWNETKHMTAIFFLIYKGSINRYVCIEERYLLRCSIRNTDLFFLLAGQTRKLYNGISRSFFILFCMQYFFYIFGRQNVPIRANEKKRNTFLKGTQNQVKVL